MVNVNRVLAVLSLMALVAGGAAMIACGGSTSEVPGNGTGPEVTNPETGIAVRATIASADLGDSSANVQIAFFATDATAAASIVVTSVTLVDANNGSLVDTLQASTPAVWNGRTYETWNEKVTPGGDLRASYQLTPPKWSAIDGTDTRSSRATSYSTPYKLRITLRIDGAEMTIESGELHREPVMVT